MGIFSRRCVVTLKISKTFAKVSAIELIDWLTENDSALVIIDGAWQFIPTYVANELFGETAHGKLFNENEFYKTFN